VRYPILDHACEVAVKRKGTWLVAALTLMAGMGSDWIRPTTRVRCLPGIPERDYKLVEPTLPPPVQGLSFSGVELVDQATKKKLRTFAMDVKELKILHCSISQVAFTIGEDGSWIFNCQADQNPWFTTQANSLPPARLAGQLRVETNQFLRNEFSVTVRCYGNFLLKETLKSTGKPALATITPKSFWVQRGVPLMVKASGDGVAELKQNYSLIDRVEFDFSYR
jgi:hypothetical protein